MECKGNIAKNHETKGEGSPQKEKKSNDTIKLNGNIDIVDLTIATDEVKEESLEINADFVRNIDDCNTNTVQSSQPSREPDVKQQTENTAETANETGKHQKDTVINAEIEESQKLQPRDDVDISEVSKDDINLDCCDISEDLSQNENTGRVETECNLSRFKAENVLNTNNNHSNPFQKTILTSVEKEPPELERLSVRSDEKESDICTHPCDFCKNVSLYVCQNCNYFYCTMCRNILHPPLGPYKCHKVIPVVRDTVQRHEICKEHGVVAQLFCSYCEQKRCVECANTRCFLHFKGRVSEGDIEREKKDLVEKLEEATLKMGFLGRYKDMVEEELETIEFTGLLRKEQIRQEFVSFHDLLIEKEAEMLQQLELDVQVRRDHVKNTLQSSVARLEQDDAELTTTVTELVQSENDAHFIEECVKAKDLCAQISDKVQDFNRAWAKNSKYTCRPLLDYQFSMFLEKRQLLNRLDATVAEERPLEFNQKTLFLNDTSGPLQISDYLYIPVLPTSTEVCYTMQLFARGKQVYEKKTKDILDLTINTDAFKLEQFGTANCFLLKIYPSYKCFISDSLQNDKYGNPTHMFIVVDYTKSDSKQEHITNMKMEKGIQITNKAPTSIRKVVRKIRR